MCYSQNIYVVAGQVVKKKPGCSWFDVHKDPTFLSGDKSYPEIKKINVGLERLAGQMKAEGYVCKDR